MHVDGDTVKSRGFTIRTNNVATAMYANAITSLFHRNNNQERTIIQYILFSTSKASICCSSRLFMLLHIFLLVVVLLPHKIEAFQSVDYFSKTRTRSISFRKQPPPASFSSSQMTSYNDGDDEFGDDSFLMDIDLDAIAASAAAAETTTGTMTTKSTTPVVQKKKINPYSNSKKSPINDENESENAAKKRKVSISPSTTKSNEDVQAPPSAAMVAQAADLEKTLLKYFGYPKFRGGQLEAIQAICTAQTDVAVFWATGKGKSLCYQIPALFAQNITVVVSPLISLMRDQVHKLNGLSAGQDGHAELATFLGSGQMDASQERAALRGQFLLVYVTPEKLLSAGFLQQLSALHANPNKRQIGLFAVDEAHCVSEWGHDFRPEFRQIGDTLRTQAPPNLRDIPIMALTATAVPRVQHDICQSLHLRSPKVFRQSFDRPNLVLKVIRKDRSMALASAMEPLVQALVASTKPEATQNQQSTTTRSSSSNLQQQSTIIYVPTRNQVDDVVAFLKQRLTQQQVHASVEGYHAGMSLEERNRAHVNFLTGKTTVICATVAFGMGIDKPDTRRVIHYGTYDGYVT